MNDVAESERISRNLNVTKPSSDYGADRANFVPNRKTRPMSSVPTIETIEHSNSQLALSTLLALANAGLGVLHRHQCSVFGTMVATRRLRRLPRRLPAQRSDLKLPDVWAVSLALEAQCQDCRSVPGLHRGSVSAWCFLRGVRHRSRDLF